MKLDTFFNKFDQFADAPGALAKMRELIMCSAFSGAFSAEERNQPMPEEWAVEGAPTLPAIPSSWKWQRGSEVFDVIRGVTYKKNDASESPVEGSFPLLRASNIGNGITFDGLIYVPRDNIRDAQFVRRGDILIAMSSGSKTLVGKAAPIVTEFIGAFGAFCGIIRNKSAIPDEVLARYFQSPQYTSWVTAAGRGIGINNLGRGNLDLLPVPTPPLAEQKRIVAQVDELMALCDRLQAQQQERETRHAALARASLARFADAPTSANLSFLFHKSYIIPPSDLRKSILTLGVQGKLVPQNPNDESAEEFLDRTKSRHAQSSNGSASRRERETAKIEDDEIPFAIPDSWAWCRLETIADRVTDGEHLSPVKTTSGMPLLTATHVTARGVTLSNPQYVSVQDCHKFRQRCDPTRGDILICSRGTIGRCAVVETDEVFCLMGSVILVRFPAEASPRFFNYFLSTDLAQTEMRGMSGATAVQALYLKDIRRALVAIPPVAEQRRIAAKVDQLMALVDELETQLAASRTTGADLMEAVVAELTARGLTYSEPSADRPQD